ncbi:MAG TPA: hypothetical protein VGA20_08215 [Gemmatimonadales bacterium]
MTALAFTLSLMLGAPAGPSGPAVQAPARLHCLIEIAAGASGRCRIRLPPGRQVRRCGDADRQAGHCDRAVGEGRYVAWVVGTGPGRCRITKKKTAWDKSVAAKVSKSTGAGSTCDLYVELQ